MSLNKENIANWLEKLIANDYFRFELICSNIEVTNFEQDGNTLTVEYHHWDDGRATDDSSYYIFDYKIGQEYGVNFPSLMMRVNLKDKFRWANTEKCLALDNDLLEEEHLDLKIEYFKWGDPEIENWVDYYFNFDDVDIDSLKEMLVEKYGAKEKLPEIIPLRLQDFFKKVLSS